MRTPLPSYGLLGASFDLRRASLGLACLAVASVAFPNLVFSAGPVGSLGQVIILLSAALTAVHAALRGFRRPGVVYGCLLLFVLFGLGSAVWSIDLSATFYRFVVNLELLFLVFIVFENAASRGAWERLLQGYVYGAWLSVLNIFLNYRRDATYLEGQLLDQRYSALGFDPNDVAVIVALAVPAAWYLGLLGGRGRAPLFNRLFPLAATAAVLLSGSRTGVVALVVSFFYVVWSAPRLSRRVRQFGSLALLLAMAYAASAAPEVVWQRLEEGIDSTRTLDFTGRGAVWAAGLEVFAAHPLLGTGAGTFPVAVEATLHRTKAPHNTFISVMVEQGLVGLALFLLVLTFGVRLALRAAPLERALFVTLLGAWFVGAMMLGWEYRKPTWLLFALLSTIYSGRAGLPRPFGAPPSLTATRPPARRDLYGR